MVKRRAAGFTLLEIVVAMAVFGIFLFILILLTSEMNAYEKRLPINFMKHPQVVTVISRLRKDVLDADNDPYEAKWPATNPQYEMGPQVLIIRTWDPTGRKTVVWDFRTPGEVRRTSYNVGIASSWIARGLPADISYVEIGAVKIPGQDYAVRLTAKDKKGRIAIDQIFQPRAHK